MKKIVLTLALIFTLLVGCGSPAAPAAGSAAGTDAKTNTAAPENPASETASLGTAAPELASADPAAPEATEPGLEEVPVRWRNGGELRFLSQEALTIPKLSEMECEKLDTEDLIAKMEAITKKAADCNDAQALLADYYELCPELSHYCTMSSLAYIRYTQDCTDDGKRGLYQYYASRDALLDEAQKAMYAALAGTSCRSELERAYFGEGFFSDYDDYNDADEAYYALVERESELVSQYYDLTADGVSVFDDSSVRSHHDELAKLFVELVKIRGQIAAAKGCDNYMDYCYPILQYRDYTPAQARAFLDQVQVSLAPLAQYDRIMHCEPENTSLSSDAYDRLRKVARDLGGPIWEAFRFMTGYELYDISASEGKNSGAYMIYLNDYEAPAIIVDPANASYTTFAHEFGHFVDYYYSFGAAGSKDIDEIYSQVMEYLFLVNDDTEEWKRQQNARAQLADSLSYSILRECAYADFELQVYALKPEELSPEKIDSIFFACMAGYGLISSNADSLEGKRWVGYRHFFAYPGYVISYSTSAVAALEICAMEYREPGAGVEAFCRLLNRTPGKKFAYVLEEAGLDSPFEAETLTKIADFIKETFELN